MADETSLNGAPNNGAPDVFVATYHDTADRRLARAHIALRRRLRNGTGLWEAEIGGEVLSAPGGPATLPEELAQRLTAPLHNRKLEEVVRLRTGTEDVALLEGQHVLRSYATLDSALRDTVTPTRVPRTRKRAPAIEHVRAYLRAQVAEIERTDPLIRSGDDPDALHDFRVAVRRMRSVLKSTRALFDEAWLKALRAELRWIGGELAAARDLDVLLASLGKKAGPDELPVVRLLETERRRAWKRARKALSGERYLKLLDRLTSAVEAPPVRQAGPLAGGGSRPGVQEASSRGAQAGTEVERRKDPPCADPGKARTLCSRAGRARGPQAGAPLRQGGEAVPGCRGIAPGLRCCGRQDPWGLGQDEEHRVRLRSGPPRRADDPSSTQGPTRASAFLEAARAPGPQGLGLALNHRDRRS